VGLVGVEAQTIPHRLQEHDLIVCFGDGPVLPAAFVEVAGTAGSD
jgi:hypothetical protein